jgi:hypothetical protein
MSNRFPPLAHPIPSAIPARTVVFPMLPHWTRSLPITETLVLALLGAVLALA